MRRRFHPLISPAALLATLRPARPAAIVSAVGHQPESVVCERLATADVDADPAGRGRVADAASRRRHSSTTTSGSVGAATATCLGSVKPAPEAGILLLPAGGGLAPLSSPPSAVFDGTTVSLCEAP